MPRRARHGDQLRFFRREATRRVGETGSRIGMSWRETPANGVALLLFAVWNVETRERGPASGKERFQRFWEREPASICIHWEMRALKFLGACSRTRSRIYSLTRRDRRGFWPRFSRPLLLESYHRHHVLLILPLSFSLALSLGFIMKRSTVSR